MNWEEAKNMVLKSALGVLLAWCGWTFRESARAAEQLKEAVSELRAVVWELRAGQQATRDQVQDIKERLTRLEDKK